METEVRYLCRIHTKQYAGNFHRELGVYITGLYDETISLEPEDGVYEKCDNFFDTVIPHIHPEYGQQTCPMIQSSYLTDNCGYNSVELAFSEELPEEIKEWIKHRVAEFAKGNIAKYASKLDIIGVEFLKQTISTVEEVI